MPRPLSWLPRLRLIRQTLGNSARSHLQRRDLETLFELQPRAAQVLMESLPTVGIGRSRLVEREALLALLEKVQKADDPAAVLAAAREEQSRPRRSLREYMPHELPPAHWEALPASLTLAPGQVQIAFGSMEELAASLVQLASLLQERLEEFECRYAPRRSSPEKSEAVLIDVD